MPYIGRFAPSPTGHLHAGSLITALATWLDARHHNGRWLLRIEDIDPPREVAGASESIINSLRAHQLEWDDTIQFQSQRSPFYEQALQQLREQNKLYACCCTRKQLRAIAETRHTHSYPGTCRDLDLPEGDSALRLRIDSGQVSIVDALAGPIEENVQHTVGDFIIRRRGPLFAYQLAVVVDDALQGITHVVRGADLLDNTARQVILQRALGYPTPAYLHIPLAVQADGRKLSKQTGAKPINNSDALCNLQFAWKFLGQQQPDADLGSVAEFLQFAVPNWRRDRIPATLQPISVAESSSNS